MTRPIGTIFSLDIGTLQPLASSITSVSTSTDHITQALSAVILENESDDHQPSSLSTGTTCVACGIGVGSAAHFADKEEQRTHFKTDWHRYNVKRRVAGLGTIPESEFLALLENNQDDDVGSLSGSDTSDDDDDEEKGQTSDSGPQFVFSSTGASTNQEDDEHQSQRLAVWRCLVAADKDRNQPHPQPAQCLANLENLITKGGRWAVILSRGGHFAAAVYDVIPPSQSSQRKERKASVVADNAVKELLHKSFHRYVVRAKAGGKQSTKDASGKYARSAGSRLRRYNEQALTHDITTTLSEWKETLDSCTLILLAAPGSNGQVLFSGDAPVLNRKDERIRKVPFVTRRPTSSEAKRVARVLLTVYSLADASTSSDTLDKADVEEEEIKKAKDSEEVKARASSVSNEEALERAKEEARLREEAARAKKAEKRARQKQREKEQRQAAAAEKAAVEADASAKNADDEIARAALQAAAKAQKLKEKAAATNAQKHSKASVPASIAPARLNSRSLAAEDPATRRARVAAAAEARMKALQTATQQQKLH